MDFFQHQDNARRRTKALLFYYVLALLALTLALYALVAFAAVLVEPDYAQHLERVYFFEPVLFFLTACGVGLLVGGASFFKSIELAGGGGDAVAQQLGGRRVSPSTTDFSERRLMNVVEELAIASGINVPNVYILDNEKSINAFAAGFSPNSAAIGVTRGTLNYLTRDELQGVIGHEFSHVLNGDMRINLRLISILFGLNLLVIIGSMLMRIMWYSNLGRSRSRSDKNTAGIQAIVSIVGIGLFIIGAVGMFFSQLIQAAISRQREYLADASAVQFTRNPGGIAGALKKIGCGRVSSAVKHPNSGEASHMFIANIGGLSAFANLLATHPPLTDRIRAIEPSFNGRFPEVLYPVQQNAADLKARPLPAIQQGATPQTNTPANTSASTPKAPPNPLGVLGRIGNLDVRQIAVAAALLEEIPADIRNNAHEPFGARAVLFATLISGEPEVRERQWGMLQQNVEPQCLVLARTMFDQLANFPVESKIPLVQQSLPALRQLSSNQYRTFRKVVENLVAADGVIDLFEYTLRGLLLNDLDVHFGLIPQNPAKLSGIQTAAAPMVAVLSNLAHAGHTDKTEIEKAFKAGLTEFGITGFLQPPASCTFASFDAALKKLSQFTPAIKKKMIAAFTACISADDKITPKEGELLRAICATLGCPVPMFGK